MKSPEQTELRNRLIKHVRTCVVFNDRSTVWQPSCEQSSFRVVTVSDERHRVGLNKRNKMKQLNAAAKREGRLPRRQTVAGLRDKLQACSE